MDSYVVIKLCYTVPVLEGTNPAGPPYFFAKLPWYFQVIYSAFKKFTHDLKIFFLKILNFFNQDVNFLLMNICLYKLNAGGSMLVINFN